jgi:hypothetical protein
LGSHLAHPREVRSPEKEVLEWWPPVRVRERESKVEDNGRGFKYPRTHAQLNIVRADRTLSGLAGLCPATPDFVQPGLSVHREIVD